jgi:hypothetical protein
MLADAFIGDKRLERFRHTRRELERRPPRRGCGVTACIGTHLKVAGTPPSASNRRPTLKVPRPDSRWEANA